MAERRELMELAARQHGVVSRRQVTNLGIGRGAFRWWIDTRRLEWLTTRVVRVVGSAETTEQRAMAAALDATNGVVAWQSALGLGRLPGYSIEPVHVLTTRLPHRGTAHLGIVHSSTRLNESDVGLVEGIPVTTPARTLFDLSSRFTPPLLGELCDDLLRRRMMGVEELHSLAARVPLRGGPRGRHTLRSLASARPLGYRPTDSRLERRFEEIVEKAGDAPFQRQIEIFDDRGLIGRVDFVDRRLRVVVEVQSEIFHSSLTDCRRDADRIARLRASGWIVIEITEDEIWRRSDRAMAKVRAGRAQAARRAP